MITKNKDINRARCNHRHKILDIKSISTRWCLYIFEAQHIKTLRLSWKNALLIKKAFKFENFKDSLQLKEDEIDFVDVMRDFTEYMFFFYMEHFYKQRQAEIGKKSSKC